MSWTLNITFISTQTYSFYAYVKKSDAQVWKYFSELHKVVPANLFTFFAKGGFKFDGISEYCTVISNSVTSCFKFCLYSKWTTFFIYGQPQNS